MFFVFLFFLLDLWEDFNFPGVRMIEINIVGEHLIRRYLFPVDIPHGEAEGFGSGRGI